LHLIHGEFGTGSGGIGICVGTGIDGGSCANKTFGNAAFGVSSTLGLLVELGKGERKKLVHLICFALLASEDMCEHPTTGARGLVVGQ